MMYRSLFLLAASASMLSTSAAQPINPCSTVFMQTESGWRGEIATRLGMMKGNFQGNLPNLPGGTSRFFKASGQGFSDEGFNGYKVELENTLGYKTLLDLKFRVGLGQDVLGSPLMEGGTNYAAEADAIAFFRFNVNQKAKVNLLPNVGFAWRQFYTKYFSEQLDLGEGFDKNLVRILSPLLGINIEVISPLSKLYVNAGIFAFMPSIKAKVSWRELDSGVNTIYALREAYHGARHGLGTSFEIKYAITAQLALSAKLDYEAFGAKGSVARSPTQSLDMRTVFSSAFTSAVFGVDYFF